MRALAGCGWRPRGAPLSRLLSGLARCHADRTIAQGGCVDFELPAELIARLAALDDFIDREIVPLQASDDNERFFDHRREWARTDFENGGVPRREWEELLREMFR